ncbi:TonB-dependent receptor family protein [Thermomonas carbonis]|uniref:TonB-dependent receptor n=1 Tax=Thermomonas carbonis TaxID=1463158 RepID=A0A7G9ST57_9GAMM|nr:TonB-dependent receptor [Thermomonas carbonis]QNN71032.1 TonB-dependent receptor [Thermomonas carbonis]
MWPAMLLAQDTARTLDTVVVTAAPLPSDRLRQPSATSVVDGDALRARNPLFSTEEALRGIPGVSVRDRQNAAQDLQLSIRGAGARSAFGMRGVRVIVDGIPATMPDGQSQLGHLDLGTLQRLEILRGPLAILQGNAAAGVIVATTERGREPTGFDADTGMDSLGQRRWGAGMSTAAGTWDLRAGIGRLWGDGMRAQSASEREHANLRSGFEHAALGRIDLIVNHVRQFAQDPQGLTRAELEQDPTLAAPAALAFDTRKYSRQDQAGFAWHKDLSASSAINVAVYTGSRDILQFQSIPVATQAAPGHGGAVIGFDRRYDGVDANWRHRGSNGWRASAGLTREHMREDRRGWENFVRDTRSTVLGVRGVLRRDERNLLRADGAYVQVQWPLAEAWSLDAGLRHSRIDVASRDRFLGNGDDGGSLRFVRSSPVAALHWHSRGPLALHLAWGRGFETPTLNELAYAPVGDGPNRALRPAVSSQWELAGRWVDGAQEWNWALFDVRSRDEIVVASSSGGRTTYRNAASGVRRGAELGWTLRGDRWDAALASTWLDARLQDAGSVTERLPGTARAWGSAELRYRLANDVAIGIGVDASTAIEAGAGVRAPGFAKWHLLASRAWTWRGRHVQGFARIDNVLDRRFAGSVIVAQAQGRYFEPAPGRSLVIGIEVATGER